VDERDVGDPVAQSADFVRVHFVIGEPG
jgi:hypothetical protein